MKNDCQRSRIKGFMIYNLKGSDIRNGGRGIRTPAGCDTPSGFRNRPLQPDLGIPPYENGAYRIRTDDLLRAGQALSQLS